VNYLIDTHTFLWFINDDPFLSLNAKVLIENPQHHIYLSVASLWEMAIKISLGKLELPLPFDDFINRQLDQNLISLLPITTAHTALVATLPFHHRDPFDRLIIAQSQSERLPIIGKDTLFDLYPIIRYW
jgi:PIN domain nuclease of toxin-antitoxin system